MKDDGTYTQSIHNLFTRSHPSEEENRSKNWKCKRALILKLTGMGGHLAGLKNIAVCQDWRKQRLKKNMTESLEIVPRMQ
jgi:hypothetical protein